MSKIRVVFRPEISTSKAEALALAGVFPLTTDQYDAETAMRKRHSHPRRHSDITAPGQGGGLQTWASAVSRDAAREQPRWNQDCQAGAGRLQAAGLVRLNGADEEVLTPDGHWELLRALDHREGARAGPDKPRWDGESLWWRGQLVKNLGETATVQKELLEELTKAGWPEELPVPGGRDWRETLKRWRRGAAGLTACQGQLLFLVRANASKRVLRWKAIQ
jgi:hypothetical protein